MTVVLSASTLLMEASNGSILAIFVLFIFNEEMEVSTNKDN